MKTYRFPNLVFLTLLFCMTFVNAVGWALSDTTITLPLYGGPWTMEKAREEIAAFSRTDDKVSSIEDKEKSLAGKGMGYSADKCIHGVFSGEIPNSSDRLTALACIADEKIEGKIQSNAAGNREGSFSGGSGALWNTAKEPALGSYLLAPGRSYAVTGRYTNDCYKPSGLSTDVDGCSIYQVITTQTYGIKMEIYNPTGGQGGAWEGLGSTPATILQGSKLVVRLTKTLGVEWPLPRPSLQGFGANRLEYLDGDTSLYFLVSFIGTNGDGVYDISVQCCGETVTGKVRLVSLDKKGYKGGTEGNVNNQEEYYTEDGGGVGNTVLCKTGHDFRVSFKAETGVTTETLVPIGLRWGVYESLAGDTPIESGTGRKATGVSCSKAEQNYGVKFYIDTHVDDKGFTCEQPDVYTFTVKSISLIDKKFTVKYASVLTSSTAEINGAVDGWLSTGNGLLQQRTHPDDYRALTNLQRKDSASTYTVSATKPGEINFPSDWDDLFDAGIGANIIIVRYFDRSTGAAAISQKGDNILIMPLNTPTAATCTHEIGHSVADLTDLGNGCCKDCKIVSGTDFNLRQIMYHSPDKKEREYLNKSHAAAFQK